MSNTIKPAVSSYSFAQYINCGKMTYIDAIRKAKEIGFEGIEISDATGLVSNGATIDGIEYDGPALAKLLYEESQKQGLPIIGYDVGSDMLKDYPNVATSEIERIKTEIDMAALMGAKVLRHDASFGHAGMDFKSEELFDEMMPVVAEGCREIAKYGETKGVRIMVENHGQFFQDSHRVEKLIKAVDHPNFGWLVDIGNFLCADEENIHACTCAAKYAFHVHAKDFHYKSKNDPSPGEGFFQTRDGNLLRGAILGHGMVPVVACLDIIKKSGYQGYVSLEFEGMEDCLKAIPIGCANLVNYLKD